jgi:hypothetical protein
MFAVCGGAWPSSMPASVLSSLQQRRCSVHVAPSSFPGVAALAAALPVVLQPQSFPLFSSFPGRRLPFPSWPPSFRPFGSHHFPLFLLLLPRGRCWWFLGSGGRATCSGFLCHVSVLFNKWPPKRSSIALNMEGLISSTLLSRSARRAFSLLHSRGGRSDSEAEPLHRGHSCV